MLEDRRLPSRQGRRAFAYLAVERQRPVPRDELAEAVWDDAPPPAWESALSALLSKLRAAFAELDGCGAIAIASAFGCHQLRLPQETWIDVEAAARAIDQAEGFLRAGLYREAWGPALVAATIGRRPFLPGDEGGWIERQRRAQHELLLRALDCLTQIALTNGEAALAARLAGDCITLEPFRERGYQRLMQAHLAAGERAEALRAYERCRRLLAAELGVDPSPELQALYLSLLRSP